MKTISPGVMVWGVETVGADAMAQSVAANRLVELPEITSIARTLGAPKVSEMTLSAVETLVEEVLVVEDAAAFGALQLLLERTKILTEPAAACCLAAAQRHRGTFATGEKIVLLLCGGNLSLADLCGYRQRFAGG
jgi:threonine dehydratase